MDSSPSHLGRLRRREGRAFTLIELLVVVAIIALLITILAPSLGRTRELVRRTICATNLQVIGRGWHMYFVQSNYRTPNMFNWNLDVSDSISQFNFLIWTFASGDDFCNAGVLYKCRMVPNERVYICPTLASHVHSWFGPDAVIHRDPGAWTTPRANPWPPVPGRHSFMTYGTRRMKNYDNHALAALGDYDTDDDEIMIWSPPYLPHRKGVKTIPNWGNFSFMADSFCMPETAMASHVPGINVLYLDGRVKFWQDKTGSVLYDNGIVGWNRVPNNWLHDDIWMTIDGYHPPPGGQGK